MSGWFDQLRLFFSRRDQPTDRKAAGDKGLAPPAVCGSESEARKSVEFLIEKRISPAVSSLAGSNQRRSMEHLLVVGLDFGTAYTKCVVRDALVRDPGKAYPVSFELADGWSYTVPSVVMRQGTSLISAFDGPMSETEGRIDYLKMRLVSEIDQQRAGAWRDGESAGEMQAIVAWFLGQVLARVGQEIHRRWPDFGDHPGDQCFINICVPIAHADGSRVEQCILDALCAARTALGPAGTLAPSLEGIRAALLNGAELQRARAYCYTYPETSANLQSYLKSRARRPGLYLFADVGAGTVDLSFFQLLEDTGVDAPLLYYHAAVLDAGSSRIELKAKASDSGLSLADLIAAKEERVRHPNHRIVSALAAARKVIHDEVGCGVGNGVKVTESKLHIARHYQLTQMRNVIFMHAGGGYARNPYGEALTYFYRNRQWGAAPTINPLPIPDDLVWASNGKQIPFARLSVAYGLAFPRYELDGHKFPSEVALNPDIAVPPQAERPSAPSKDEV